MYVTYIVHVHVAHMPCLLLDQCLLCHQLHLLNPVRETGWRSQCIQIGPIYIHTYVHEWRRLTKHDTYVHQGLKLAVDILTTHQPHQQTMTMHVFIEGKTSYNIRTYTQCRASRSELVTLKVLLCAHDYIVTGVCMVSLLFWEAWMAISCVSCSMSGVNTGFLKIILLAWEAYSIHAPR